MTTPRDDDRLLEHEYDGIQEFDNPMPKWWLYLFWVTIAWSVLYWFNVPGIGIGKGQIADYDASMAGARAARPTPPPGGPGGMRLTAMSRDPKSLAAGKALFASYCAACHGAEGGGVIGPNLTDDAWIHGGAPEAVYHTVEAGVLAKGMPAWGQSLNPRQVSEVVAYVLSLRGTHPANPKAPEGVVDGPPPRGE